jgi:hypothetical protein
MKIVLVALWWHQDRWSGFRTLYIVPGDDEEEAKQKVIEAYNKEHPKDPIKPTSRKYEVKSVGVFTIREGDMIEIMSSDCFGDC